MKILLLLWKAVCPDLLPPTYVSCSQFTLTFILLLWKYYCYYEKPVCPGLLHPTNVSCFSNRTVYSKVYTPTVGKVQPIHCSTQFTDLYNLVFLNLFLACTWFSYVTTNLQSGFFCTVALSVNMFYPVLFSYITPTTLYYTHPI